MKLPEPINIFVHFMLGVWAGFTLNDRKYQNTAFAFIGTFLFYQALEAWRKGDGGYQETKQFMIGMSVALIIKRFYNWLDVPNREKG